ncbi:formin-binding protein 4-like isoform X2 [Leptopilina boulardi]|uniref:formin-binding protein 4-like isoform X2 n=1 Tax=Leptopilina boulardi TaxID=63433 RepID=UPI0021F5F849|nr:formin-binding protein 4-like isoform X2 [Leptopilina boulardi]
MKRRQRRPILDIDGEHSNSPVRFSQEIYKQSSNLIPGENGSNPLKGLLGQYNSDSETDDVQQTSNKLDDKVNDFFKEIQSIAPENSIAPPKDHIKGKSYSIQPEMPWQECFDESTGYPYYWHTNTNQVTWEMPPEYRLWKEKKQMTVNQQHNLHVGHWPGVSSNSEIPEGMIPKEVVARNRNRQAGIQENQVPLNTKQLDTSIPPHLRDDDSDDGKIEMITSFGNEESEESESDSHVEEIAESKPKKVHHRKPSDYSSRERNNEVKSSSQSIEIGPSLPPEMQEKISESSNGTEEDILRRLKNQAKLLQSMEKNTESNSRGGSPFETEHNKNKIQNESEKSQTQSELKVSLVPGYEDDSDNDEEIPPASEIKPLFPIVEYETDKPTIKIANDGIVKKVETRQTETGCIRIFEYRNVETEKTDTTDIETKELNKEIDNVDNSESESRINQPSQDIVKVNKFLENLETPTKAFQRKKRIAFDVLPNRPKVVETQELPSTEESQTANTNNESDRFGFGFQKEKEEVTETESMEIKPEVPVKSEKELISFVKGETINNSTKSTDEVKSIPAAENKEFKYLTEMISEKLKFLSEGCQMASAVQIMAIQLQTLLEAWESGDLKQTYLHQWLTTTGRELSRLEQTAAPPGWECQWDRSHKRYYYRNAATGAAQWTYPEMDVIGGTEEMELCTTPPPEQEEPIIERDVELNQKNSTTEDNEKKVSPDVEEEITKDSNSSDIKVPPPPQISNPSPPPPPRIYAEDLKRGQKRKNSQDNDLDNKKEKVEQAPPLPDATVETSQPPLPPSPPKVIKSNEPLPPGVDPPEIPYALPATVLESGVLYAATPHQTNPIYAATMGNAILTHHTALMQGQLLHYPAYHLHNQALVAAASRLGQEGVQFMMTDYSQIYGTNQVIAKPPVKAHRESLGSAIDSFYNDIASIENSNLESEQPERPESNYPEAVSSPVPQMQSEENQSTNSDVMTKEKKKKKTKLGVGKKQKEMSSMVAKWQRVQQNYGNAS